MTWKIYRLDEKKTEKKYRKVVIEPSINENTKIPQYTPCLSFLACQKKNWGIYWLNSYNLLASKNGLKSSKQLKIIFPFTDHIKKSKESIKESQMNFPYCSILKPSNINLASVSLHVRKIFLNLLTQLLQLTDQQI